MPIHAGTYLVDVVGFVQVDVKQGVPWILQQIHKTILRSPNLGNLVIVSVVRIVDARVIFCRNKFKRAILRLWLLDHSVGERKDPLVS